MTFEELQRLAGNAASGLGKAFDAGLLRYTNGANPLSYVNFGVGEALQNLGNKLVPKASADEGSSTGLSDGLVLGDQGSQQLQLTGDNPFSTTKTKTGGTGTGGTGTGGTDQTTQSGLDALIASARDAYNRGKSNYYDPMMKMIGEKRGQFQDLFNQGQGDIAQGYSKEAGSAGRTAEAQRTATANSARALGTGGSYLMGSENRVNDALARTLASAGQTRTQNEQANRDLLGQRQDWATQQEAGLNNYLGGLQSNIDNAISGRTQAIANLNAPTVDSNYGTTKNATDFSGIVDYLNSLTGGLSTPGQTTSDQAVSINPNSALNIQDIIRARRNGALSY